MSVRLLAFYIFCRKVKRNCRYVRLISIMDRCIIEQEGDEGVKYLVKKAQRNDKEAFVELMELNKQSMYKIAKSYLRSDEDVADAMSDTILACYEKISDLREPKYFKTWMTRILINKCKDI